MKWQRTERTGHGVPSLDSLLTTFFCFQVCCLRFFLRDFVSLCLKIFLHLSRNLVPAAFLPGMKRESGAKPELYPQL